MPYLQLDVNGHYSVDSKMRLAKKLCETYSEMMTVEIRRISIAIRELGEFTQHSGDEMYHPTLGGYSPEWTDEEL